jgi:hypothetical protein
MMQMLPRNEFQTINAVFMDESNIVVNDFQYFLKHFNILYLKALDMATRMKVVEIDYSSDDDFYRDINRVLSKMFRIDNQEYREYSSQLSSKKNDLVICELDKHSPLEIIFGGSIIALVIALIVAGGKIEVDVLNMTFKATIKKSLGESIKDLRKAFK